ncbi:MAG: hypothetical protein A3C30_02725 [Candidatus Levybacteria bacterium RIFCSPHIGHO2_02_FULL_40_18]|nr:MAG: hypothetical protein A2869_05250 [Candidatus Levybacteria bacterium RIFCSPHIGHO2_01_FULL_40_58]OGH26890.1 MAG: hypothetical protein A3C30_02725 [Candidatus Levybacteria bacterium RIFCSPHIGHO2_02_FULL_40_18]OGH32012.1 MAG: hypothetical protein A3E43_03705 [Candidatus Levybacteria bacterium RIFCSPHIGHO2_12_FULL_40_31]OGH40866.1 MAG: hypothetical protein A2894_04695 [Candidatus Levybacteria bacterium RIFCSPLOWO2_01_FULL_40_64]OGH49561.1 MAG: hypothetical protein A3I54_00250 [Candidatus Lev
MRKITSLFLSFMAVAIAATAVFAAGESNCQIVYGGGEVCPPKQVKFTINKTVQKPGKGGGDFVENLTINDPRFAPDQNVNFKIIIENTGDTDVSNLNVVDSFPEFLSFVAGVGNSNVGAKQINFIIGTLKKGEKMEFVITAKTAEGDKLPANQAITCVTNNVKAMAPDGVTAQDNAQVCIEKQVLGAETPKIFEKPKIKELPPTGPELGLLAALIPTGLAGIYLRRKAK